MGKFKLEGERCVVLPPFEWRDPKMPTLQILDSLASAEWQRGVPPKAHAVDSPKRFNVSDPVQQRGYLQCLLGLDTLIAAGLRSLPSNQKPMYYAAVLAHNTPAEVPLNGSKEQYAALAILDTGGNGDESDDEHRQGVLGNGREIMACDPCPGPAPVKRRRKAAVGAPRKKNKEAAPDWADSLCPSFCVDESAEQPGQPAQPLEDVPLVPAVELPAAQGGVGQHGPATELSALESVGQRDQLGQHSQCQQQDQQDQLVQQAEPQVQQPQPQVQQPQVIGGREVRSHGERTVLEGSTVTYEKHGVRGIVGSYERLRTNCKVHGAKCKTSRSFSARLCKTSGLDEGLEPFAFLGLWLKSASLYPQENWSAHAGWRPTPQEVAAYAKEMKWV